eukprot:GHVH01005781.1.p1 GENE.GHVH01005781.1~~GHVH01005781.1.p1  ORF type:complete len:494 (+),score=67.87 GHVH01005781.1:123-1484(+)
MTVNQYTGESTFSVVLHFTPLHLIVGTVSWTQGAISLGPLTVLDARVKTTESGGVDEAAIVWLKWIIDRKAFERILYDAFDLVALRQDERQDSTVYLAWKDGIDVETQQYMTDFITKKGGFGRVHFFKESSCLLAYHSQVTVSNNDDSQEPVSQVAATYCVTDSLSQCSYRSPSDGIEPPLDPADSGTVLHISDDSITSFSYAHGTIVGRLRTAQHGVSHVKALLRLLPPELAPHASSWFVCEGDWSLEEQIEIIRRGTAGAKKSDLCGDTAMSLRPRYPLSPPYVHQWLPLAAGEILMNPLSMSHFFQPVRGGDMRQVRTLFSRPSMIEIIKSVGHENVPFDLADRLLKKLLISGQVSSMNGLAQRLATSIQKMRSEEMAQSKAASKERVGTSLARSWHLSQLNIPQLDDSLMEVRVEVRAPVDSDDGMLVVWRGAVVLIGHLADSAGNRDL